MVTKMASRLVASTATNMVTSTATSMVASTATSMVTSTATSMVASTATNMVTSTATSMVASTATSMAIKKALKLLVIRQMLQQRKPLLKPPLKHQLEPSLELLPKPLLAKDCQTKETNFPRYTCKELHNGRAKQSHAECFCSLANIYSSISSWT